MTWAKGDTVWAAMIRAWFRHPPAVVTGYAVVQSAGASEVRLRDHVEPMAFGFRSRYNAGDGRLHATERQAVEALRRELQEVVEAKQRHLDAAVAWLSTHPVA